MGQRRTSKNNPHDKLFKVVFSRLRHAADLIRALLPQGMIELLDMDSLLAEPTNTVDDSLHEHTSDLVFSVAFHGHRSRLFIVFEHKSYAKQYMTVDTLGYSSDISRAQMESNGPEQPPPMVAVMVVYHAKDQWNAPHALSEAWDVPDRAVELMRGLVYDSAFTLLDLAGVSHQTLRQWRMNPMATLALWTLARARTSPEIAAEIADVLDLFRAVAEESNALDDVLLLVRYILVVSDTSFEKLKIALLDPLGEQVTEVCMTGAERLREEGREQGLEQGLEQGRQSFLLMQLQARFGGLPTDVIQRVNEANTETLDAWGRRVLTASELDEVFATPGNP